MLLYIRNPGLFGMFQKFVLFLFSPWAMSHLCHLFWGELSNFDMSVVYRASSNFHQSNMTWNEQMQLLLRASPSFNCCFPILKISAQTPCLWQYSLTVVPTVKHRLIKLARFSFQTRLFFLKSYVNAARWNNRTSIWSLYTQRQRLHGLRVMTFFNMNDITLSSSFFRTSSAMQLSSFCSGCRAYCCRRGGYMTPGDGGSVCLQDNSKRYERISMPFFQKMLVPEQIITFWRCFRSWRDFWPLIIPKIQGALIIQACALWVLF